MVRHLPTHNLTMEYIQNERRIHPPRPRRNICNVSDPETVRPVRFELAFNEIVRAFLGPGRGRLRTLPPPTDPINAQLAHQPLDGAPGDVAEPVTVLTVDRLPHLAHPVTRVVRLIDVFDDDQQFPVPQGPG